MKNKLEKMYFSQSSLNIFSQCKTKFKKRYLDGLYWKNTWTLDFKEAIKTEKGRLFHLLAYRCFLGLDWEIEDTKEEYKELKEWMKSLEKFIKLGDDKVFYPEFDLKLVINEIKLQAKYDLIVFENNGIATIYDWKIQDKPLRKKQLEASYQTILYRYLLAKAGETIKGVKLEPENISMIYWQPTHPSKSVKINYSTELFKQDEKLIREKVNEILNFNFKENDVKIHDEKVCKYCEYCNICNDFMADKLISDDKEFDLEWDTIEEIEF